MPVCEHLWTRHRHMHQVRPITFGARHKSQLILVVEPAGGRSSSVSSFQCGQQTGLGTGTGGKKSPRELPTSVFLAHSIMDDSHRKQAASQISFFFHPLPFSPMDISPLHTTGLLLVSSSPRCHRRHAARKCPISTTTSLLDVPSTHRRSGQDDCSSTQSVLDDPPAPRPGHGRPFTGWIGAGGHWWTVRHSARQRVGVKSGGHVGWGAMQTTAQRPPRGWESARRQPALAALDEPFASGVRLSWLSLFPPSRSAAVSAAAAQKNK